MELKLSNIAYRYIEIQKRFGIEIEKRVVGHIIIDYFSITVRTASNSINIDTINDTIDSIEYQSIHQKVSIRIKILNI